MAVTRDLNLHGDRAVVLWDNLITPARITSSTGTDAVNITDPATWSAWVASVGSVVVIDLGAAVSVDTVGIAAHNLGSQGATLTVQHSSNGITWTDAVSIAPTDNSEVLHLMAPVSARYWRLWNRVAASRIGVVFIGARYEFPHAPIDSYTPLHHARTYTKLFNDSLRGQFLNNYVLASGAETDVNMGFMERSVVEDDAFRDFASAYAQGGNFFFASSPDRFPLDCGYCRANGQDAIVGVEYIEAGKLANVTFGITAYAS